MVVDIYDGVDPADLPLFNRADVAKWLAIPYSTIRRWAKDEPKEGISLRTMAEYNDRRIMADAGEMVFDENGPLGFHPDTNPLYTVAVIPTVSFGRPCATHTGIRTSMIAARAETETTQEIADDYEIELRFVLGAIEYERRMSR